MARINEHPNILAFLDMLAWAEGTSTHPHTKDDGYDVIVNGDDGDPRPNIMTSYARHPNVLVKVNTNLKSTARAVINCLIVITGRMRDCCVYRISRLCVLPNRYCTDLLSCRTALLWRIF